MEPCLPGDGLPMERNELIPSFALLVHTAFAVPIKQPLPQPQVFSFSPLRLSSLSHWIVVKEGLGGTKLCISINPQLVLLYLLSL